MIYYISFMLQNTQSKNKTQNRIQNINQEFKERDVQVQAKKRGLTYVNLLSAPINSDLTNFLSKNGLFDPFKASSEYLTMQ